MTEGGGPAGAEDFRIAACYPCHIMRTTLNSDCPYAPMVRVGAVALRAEPHQARTFVKI